MLFLKAFIVCIVLNIILAGPLPVAEENELNSVDEIEDFQPTNESEADDEDEFRQGQTKPTGVGLSQEDFDSGSNIEIVDTPSNGLDGEDPTDGNGTGGTGPGVQKEQEAGEEDPPDPNGKSKVKKWPKAKIYYEIAEPDDKSLRFSKAQKALIASSICLIELRSCVRFIYREKQRSYVSVERQSNPSSCSGKVGKVGGKQVLKLAPKTDKQKGCFESPGPGAHEFLHAAGFFHEHQRTDRNQYIYVNFSNIEDNRKGQFEYRYPPSGTYAGNVTYDLTSLMQYSETGFAKKGTKSMTPLDPTVKKLGQRKDLTKSDVKRLNLFYKCKKRNGEWEVDGEKAEKTKCKKAKGMKDPV